MRVKFLYRLKKYGTWIQGIIEIPNNNTTDLRDLITQSLQESNPSANRIEITSIQKIN